jgi:dipeptidyl aminopeptidase/acylaminoacyl peptidase
MTRRTQHGNPAALVLLLSLPLALGAVAGCATTSPRGDEKEAKPADIDSLKNVGAKANALVVFASSRAGTSHLFTVMSDGTELTQLTEGKQTDWNPRFSPDGSKVLFSRSAAKADVRESNAGDGVWDLYTVGTDGQVQPTKVVSNAMWGSWISNDEVLFVRGSRIMRAKVGGGEEDDGEKKEKKVMDLSKHAVFEGAIVRAPELSRDGTEIAMTLTGARRQVGIWSLKKKSWTQIGSGSLIAFTPDGSAVTWVSPTGKDLAEIRSLPVAGGAPKEKPDAEEQEKGEEPQKKGAKDAEEAEEAPEGKKVEASKLVDLPGKRSRESFPRLSADGKWLVFGAGVGSSDPDLEDYEIYLWELGSTESPTRLTFHSASDRWPDILVGAAGKHAAPKTEEAPKEEAAAKPAEEPEAAPAKAEPEKQEEPATSDAMPPSDEEAEAAGSGKAKAKPKAKGGKKKKR